MSGSTSPKKGNVLVLVGTRKGAFIFSSSSDCAEWELSGPYWPGSDIFHVVYDGRGDGCLYVVENNPIFGAQIHISRDFGTTWTSPQKGPQIGSTSGFNLNRLWQVTPGPENHPDVSCTPVVNRLACSRVMTAETHGTRSSRFPSIRLVNVGSLAWAV